MLSDWDCRNLAEREGFEPSVQVLARTTVQQTAAFSHSATSPAGRFTVYHVGKESRCRVNRKHLRLFRLIEPKAGARHFRSRKTPLGSICGAICGVSTVENVASSL